MPEAPEVESVRSSLEKELIGQRIKAVQVYHPKMVLNESVQAFEEQLRGQTFEKIERLGKYLVFTLSRNVLIAHLRMEGKFIVTSSLDDDAFFKKHVHCIFLLSDGRYLCYMDTRKFGRMAIEPKKDLHDLEALSKMGLDVTDPALNAEYLRNKWKRKSLAIKSALLDQSVIAGIGNIYANEILFAARIHPATPVKNLTMDQLERIVKATKEIMSKAFAARGTTIRSFSFGNHETGSFQNRLQVHGKEKDPCPVCGHPIEKVVIGQRSTYYCPVCQKEESPSA